MTPAGQGFDIALIWLIAGWVVIGIGGLVLMWALFRDRSRGKRRCPKCWYDMKGVPGLRCPECGRESKNEKRLLKTRRRWRWAVLAVLLMSAGFTATYTPAVRDRGLLAVLPRPVIRVGLWWERERARELCNAALAVPRRASPRGWMPIGVPQTNTSLRGLLAPPSQTFDDLLTASEIARRINTQRVLGDREKISELVQVLATLGPNAWPAANSVAGAMTIGVDPLAGSLLAVLVVSGDTALHRALEDQALNGDSIDARCGALDALTAVAIAQPETLARFGSVLAQSKAPSAGEALVRRSLATWGDPAPQLLMLAARHPDPELRRAAGVTLASHTPWYSRFDDFAEVLVADPSPSVRAAGVQALVRVNALRQVWGMAVVRACEDENVEVRRAGLSTLREWRHRTDWSDGLLREWLALRDIEAIPPTGRRVMPQWERERLDVSLGDAEESP